MNSSIISQSINQVQPALLLHVHEDGQLPSEEKVSRPSGISYLFNCSTSMSGAIVNNRLPSISLLQLLTLLLHRQHLVDAGLMRDDELKVLQDLDTKVSRRRLICSLNTLLLIANQPE